MTHYDDLSVFDRFGLTDGPLLAVGWLHRDHPFRTGLVSRAFVDVLVGLLANPWQPFVTAGRHPCVFCAFSGGPSEVRVDDIVVPVGATNVFVPANEGVYVAPSLILHYIDSHGYAPPDAFQRAVEACPPMRSMEYLKAIQRHGVNRLAVPRAR